MIRTRAQAEELFRRTVESIRGGSLAAAWARAEEAYYLPDDGIVDWSLTLWHDSAGWHAAAWRSDTTDYRTENHPTALAALEALADREGIERREEDALRDTYRAELGRLLPAEGDELDLRARWGDR